MVLNLMASLASCTLTLYLTSKILKALPRPAVEGAPRLIFKDRRKKPKVPVEKEDPVLL
jgi:hypothetical protein